MTWERIYIPEVDQSNALNAAADKAVTRDQMAEFYADCLENRGSIDWPEVNLAVMARWPMGLEYIKKKAWKVYGARHGRIQP